MRRQKTRSIVNWEVTVGIEVQQVIIIYCIYWTNAATLNVPQIFVLDMAENRIRYYQATAFITIILAAYFANKEHTA